MNAGCKDHTFTFVLENRVEEKNGVVSGTILSADGLVVADKNVGQASNFLAVDPLTFLSKSITTSNTDPCGSNTVTVSFSPAQDIYARCVSSITIFGLSGSKSETGTGPNVYGTGVTQNLFASGSSWSASESSTSITIDVESDLTKNNIVTFSFDLTNSHEQQAPITDAAIKIGDLSMPVGEDVFSSSSVMEIDVRHDAASLVFYLSVLDLTRTRAHTHTHRRPRLRWQKRNSLFPILVLRIRSLSP